MTEPIDISEPTNALCELLGLEPDFVQSMTITPRKVKAVVCLKNTHGKPYLTPPPDVIGVKRQVAVETRTFKVTT